jgi:DNA/RNA endonuclease G (NUC1)
MKPAPVYRAAVATTKMENRSGYDENFLGSRLNLPTLKESGKTALPQINSDPGSHKNLALDYTHFSILFNKEKKLPFYTAVNIDGLTNLAAKPHEERGTDKWLADYRIKDADRKTFQYGGDDYKNSGFQRGHMVRYFDPAWGETDDTDQTAMGDTFHYTNCCPQIPYYNSVVWNYLEDYYLARSIFQDNKLSVFTGPIFNKAETMNGLLVPLNFWKVVVYRNNNKLSALGFIMSHEKYFDKLKIKGVLREQTLVKPTLKASDIARLYAKKELIDAKVKISMIESKTGISFGLNTADEMKDSKHVQVISGSEKDKHLITEMDVREQESVDRFFQAI